MGRKGWRIGVNRELGGVICRLDGFFLRQLVNPTLPLAAEHGQHRETGEQAEGEPKPFHALFIGQKRVSG